MRLLEQNAYIDRIITVVRTLTRTDAKLNYGWVSILIELRAKGEPWAPVRHALNELLFKAAERMWEAGEDYHELGRIISARHGMAGPGFRRMVAELDAREKPHKHPAPFEFVIEDGIPIPEDAEVI